MASVLLGLISACWRMIGFRLPKSAGPDEGARLTPKLRRKRRVALPRVQCCPSQRLAVAWAARRAPIASRAQVERGLQQLLGRQ